MTSEEACLHIKVVCPRCNDNKNLRLIDNGTYICDDCQYVFLQHEGIVIQ